MKTNRNYVDGTTDGIHFLIETNPDDVTSLMNKVRNETIDECLGVLEKLDIEYYNAYYQDTNIAGFNALAHAIKSLKELYDTTK